MNSKIRAALRLLGLALVALLPATALANSPEQIVQEIVDKIKAASNPSPIVDYVDWSNAFEKMPASQRTIMKIDTADGLKEFYREMLSNPAKMMEERMKEQAAAMPEDKRKQVEASMGQIRTMLKQRQDQMQKQIADTKYEVGKAEVEGDSAEVKLTQTLEGESKERTIQLNKIDGKWMLDSASMFAAQAGAGAPQAGMGGPPVGGPPVGGPPMGGPAGGPQAGAVPPGAMPVPGGANPAPAAE